MSEPIANPLTDRCHTCTHNWHGLPCKGTTIYNNRYGQCGCKGPFAETATQETR